MNLDWTKLTHGVEYVLSPPPESADPKVSQFTLESLKSHLSFTAGTQIRIRVKQVPPVWTLLVSGEVTKTEKGWRGPVTRIP